MPPRDRPHKAQAKNRRGQKGSVEGPDASRSSSLADPTGSLFQGRPLEASTLVVVESPAKARSIQKMLGPGYEVRASLGHVADLPER
ncbi:MAG TPA: hypothetical protein DCR99_01955, partial [Thermus scotoductus]|nr:hypothetical protein [Thermus scotoductus]